METRNIVKLKLHVSRLSNSICDMSVMETVLYVLSNVDVDFEVRKMWKINLILVFTQYRVLNTKFQRL